MENLEIRERLLRTAAILLDQMPDVYRVFEHELNHTVAGAALVASVRRADPRIRRICGDIERPLDEDCWFDDPESVREVQNLMSQAVEGWLRDNAGRLDSCGGTRAASVVPPSRESRADRQARRYRQCIEAGLVIPADDYHQMPRGIGRLAEAEGVSRQAFTADVKAHRDYLNEENGR